MGYYTAVTGDLRWSQPLTPEQLAVIKNLYEFEYGADEYGIYFDGEQSKRYDLVDQCKEVVAILGRYKIEVTGILVAIGEEQPDIWRLVFKNGTVVREEVQMTWPDGTKYRN